MADLASSSNTQAKPSKVANQRVPTRIVTAAINAMSKKTPFVVNKKIIAASVVPIPPGRKEAAPIRSARAYIDTAIDIGRIIPISSSNQKKLKAVIIQANKPSANPTEISTKLIQILIPDIPDFNI